MAARDSTPRPDFTTCSRCGLQSNLASAFRSEGARKGGGKLCPRCALAARVDEAAATFKKSLLYAGVALALGLVGGRRHGWFVGNLSVGLTVITVGSLVLHELGHAVAAKLLAFDVFRIVLGIGPRLFETRLLGFLWEVRKYPISGVVRTATRHESGRLWRTIAMTAAGPLANLLVAAVGVLVFTHSSYSEDPFAGPAPLGTLVLINAALGVFNLMPFKTASGVDSDGRQIWLHLTRPAQRRQQLRDGYYLLKLFELREAGNSEQVAITAREALKANPANPAFWTSLGVQRMAERRYGDARAAFEDALERSQDAAHRAVNQSNLAFALLARNDASELARGEELSSAAYDALPWVPAVAHTRASYLILAARPADAVVAIQQVIDEEVSDKQRKETLYTLACAYECAGEPARAAEVRANAEHLAGDVLRYVERARATRPALATAS